MNWKLTDHKVFVFLILIFTSVTSVEVCMKKIFQAHLLVLVVSITISILRISGGKNMGMAKYQN